MHSTANKTTPQPNSPSFRNLIVLTILIGWAAPITTLAAGEFLFSPGGGVEQRILRSTNLTRRSIDVAMFNFTSGELARALVDAHRRGVRVRIILDRDKIQDPNSEYRYLIKKGLSVKLLSGRSPHGIMHHKFAIFDRREVATGSYNWTRSAEHFNNENLVVLDDPAAYAAFQGQFEKLWSAGDLTR